MTTRAILHALPASAARSCARTTQRNATVFLAQQARAAHAISNPTLANIEKRYEAMPPQEQAEMWMALRDRMKVDWKEMTMQEKKAGMSLPKCLGKVQTTTQDDDRKPKMRPNN